MGEQVSEVGCSVRWVDKEAVVKISMDGGSEEDVCLRKSERDDDVAPVRTDGSSVVAGLPG